MYPDSEQGLHYPSMYQDLNNGRPTEIDFLNGQIAKYGQELGVLTHYSNLGTWMGNATLVQNLDTSR